MAKHSSAFTRRVISAFCILASNFSLASTAMSQSVPGRSFDASTVFKLLPDGGKAGGKFELLLSAPDSQACLNANGPGISKAKLKAPAGSPFVVGETSRNRKCSFTAEIDIPPGAKPGKYAFWVVSEDSDEILGTAEFTVFSGVEAGQIPTDKPLVDIMWSVLPKEIVKHNFGNGIADYYYAVEIIIGNNSAHSLQIVGVGFRIPNDNRLEALVGRNSSNLGIVNAAKTLGSGGPSSESALIPTSGFRITRGSLEARHLQHPRTLTLSIITALGPVLTGFLPFFHQINRRANFSEGVNILSNPLEKGLELVWPDPRPLQRERFEDQVLRDGMVIRNNTQARTLAFFPKELLKLPEHFESKADYKKWRDNPREIRERLGKLVIIGDQIDFVNRVSFVANTSPIDASPIIAVISEKAFTQGTTNPVTLTGENLHDARLTVESTNEIEFKTQSVDPSGRSVTALVTVDKSVPPGYYNVIIRTPQSTQSDVRQFMVAAANFVVTSKERDWEVNQSDEKQQLNVTITGEYLHNVELVVIETNSGIQVGKRDDSTKDGMTYSAPLTIPEKLAAGTYHLELRDAANKSSTPVPFTLTVVKK
jgi:methionine-rich copper-binding protein CopC